MRWKKDLINHRREKAAETLQDAKILLGKNRLPSTVNRIYYALFYEITALLLTKDLSSSKHAGVRGLFNENFVKEGRVDIDIGKFFSKIFDFRQKGDYADFIQFDKNEVEEWLKKAEDCINELDQIIKHQL
ncbi:MAG: HEPN domain-containing protein [Candidatus Aminicenantes bacterium]|nr:HEPN domain-containing protein [Candidatus Aminicenantes bacterium]